MLKNWGMGFIVFGLFWTIGGFLSYSSDIQLGLALSGINMFGIGILMLGVNSKLAEISLKASSSKN